LFEAGLSDLSIPKWNGNDKKYEFGLSGVRAYDNHEIVKQKRD